MDTDACPITDYLCCDLLVARRFSKLCIALYFVSPGFVDAKASSSFTDVCQAASRRAASACQRDIVVRKGAVSADDGAWEAMPSPNQALVWDLVVLGLQ